jgi:predicted porin
MKPNTAIRCPHAHSMRKLMAIAVAAALPLIATGARADEVSDLKAENQMLMKRLSDMDKRLSELEAGRGAKGGEAAAAARPAALKTDQNGSPLGSSENPVMLYDSANTTMRIYGIVEATVSHADHQTDGGGTTTGFQTSWFSGNRLGFDVEHALGFGKDIGLDDLKVMSKLESEFELPSGNMDTANVLFNRDAWVGFYSDALGKVTLGRQNTLTRDFTNNWGDPYGAAESNLKEGGYSNVNNFKQLIFYSGGPNGTRYNSAIEWKKKWDPHWVTGLAYKFGSGGVGGSGDVGNGGSVPGDFTNGTAQAASVAYNGIDLGGAKMNVNLSYDRANVAELIHQSELFGGNIVFGALRWNAGVIHYTAQQGADNSMGERTDNSWTTSISYKPAKTTYSLGYQEMKGKHAGFGGSGKTLNPFGNTSGVTAVADGAKDTVYGSIVYAPDKEIDLYVVADYFHVTGDWVVGDAQGNGLKYGNGQTYKSQTEVATGVRFKF